MKLNSKAFPFHKESNGSFKSKKRQKIPKSKARNEVGKSFSQKLQIADEETEIGEFNQGFSRPIPAKIHLKAINSSHSLVVLMPELWRGTAAAAGAPNSRLNSNGQNYPDQLNTTMYYSRLQPEKKSRRG